MKRKKSERTRYVRCMSTGNWKTLSISGTVGIHCSESGDSGDGGYRRSIPDNNYYGGTWFGRATGEDGRSLSRTGSH